MNKVKIITDSCSDLSGELLAKYDIDYARMKTVYNGKETEASLTWEYYEPKELYDIMRRGERVMTVQVPAAEFMRIFRLYLTEGYDIVYIGCCEKQSGSINTGAVVAKQLKEEFPDREIYCIDALNSCMGEGMLAIRAAEERDAGKSAKEIYDAVMPIRKTVNQFVTVNDLNCLARAGRVKATKAFFGNLFGVKPILVCDKNGYQTPIAKAKGRKNSIDEVVRRMKEAIRDAQNQTIYLVHADCDPEEVEYLKNKVKEEIPCRDIYVNYIGPIIGSSVGPSTIGLYAFGEEVTFAGES